MGEWRLLEHTADMGLEASADDPAGLFAAAAEALMAILGADGERRPLEARTVRVGADDLGELMVNWLGEVLFLVEQGFVPARFEIARIGRTGLEAVIKGEFRDPGRQGLEREVKAVTYHRLQVEETDGRWRARVFVDL